MVHYCTFLWDWNTIESVRKVHNALEGGALAFFALLVLFDVLGHLSEDEHPARAKCFERVGLWCFGIAVLAEIVAFPYSERNDALSIEQDARQKDKIATLDNSTQALKTTAETARKQAEDEAAARIKVEKRLIWQGPRDGLLYGAQDLFNERLKPFTGQTVATEVCGPQAFDQGGMPGEAMLAENALSRVLIHAGWKVDLLRFPTIIPGCAAETIFLGVRPDAPQRTRDAAVELQTILNEVLLQNNDGPSRTPPPAGSGHWDGEPSAANIISITIGRHPLYPHPPKTKSK